ncbi:suppressor of fused domain protein [Frondihabitans sp. VKM Ac-2883]|nr:suppressor of fused domain protein [Frondihabitans sp. VKM Ac-2883]
MCVQSGPRPLPDPAEARLPARIRGYGQDVTTPHALIWYPFGWAGDFEPLVDDETHIEWLMAIPITDAEFTFFEANDADALIDVFEANDIDLYDLGRASAL